MSVRTATYDILQADSPVSTEISTRLYLDFAPQGTALPHIVFFYNMIEDTYTKDNNSLTDKYSVNLEIYHNSPAEAEALGLKCRTALQGYRGTINGVVVKGSRLVDERHDYEPELDAMYEQEYELIIDR